MAGMSVAMLLALGCAFATAHDARQAHLEHLNLIKTAPREHFHQWAAKHSKTYLNDAQELENRMKTWTDNLNFVLDYNSRHTTHWLGMSPFADLTHDEFKVRLGYRNQWRDKSKSRTPFTYGSTPDGALPKAIDWRKLGAVSEVKDQGQCGSCWAFSSTGAIEGANAVFTKELVSLSEQELLDCDTRRDSGCNGGLMDNAFDFVVRNGGLDTEKDYRYTASDGDCDVSKENRKVVTIDGYEDVPESDEQALKKAVAHQPVSVAIEADQRVFQLYMGGVLDSDECGTDLDHGVLVVGYGTDPKHGEFWIVKNSWGPDWGENGYIRMALGKNKPDGICGINLVASYPIKKRPNPPKPKPGPPGPAPTPPVVCDNTRECPPASTCCCVTGLLGYCLSWGCCPLPSAVCCDDHMHCCPSSLPVCDTFAGRCLQQQGSIEGSVPWSTKVPATWRTSRPIFDTNRKVVTAS